MLGAVALALLAAGCVAGYHPPEMGGLYDRAAQHHGPERNPVVVIPGMSGSTLVDDASGRVVWGAFIGDYARPGDPADARLLALPMRPGASLAELRDGVRAVGVLDRVRVRVLGIPVRVRAYVQLLAALGAGGYRVTWERAGLIHGVVAADSAVATTFARQVASAAVAPPLDRQDPEERR